MTEQWEMDIYNEIVDAYQAQVGRELNLDPFVYQQIIKLMNVIKEQTTDIDHLKEVITNAIVLLLTLFFNKDLDDDFGGDKPLNSSDRKKIKAILNDAYKIVSSKV